MKPIQEWPAQGQAESACHDWHVLPDSHPSASFVLPPSLQCKFWSPGGLGVESALPCLHVTLAESQSL